MNEMIKMIVVLTVLSVISGGALAFLQKNQYFTPQVRK